MASKGIIKEKDIITAEALKWGGKYAETVKKAIDINDEFVKSAKQLSKLSIDFGNTKDFKEFNKLLKEKTDLEKVVLKLEKERLDIHRLLSRLRSKENALEKKNQQLKKRTTKLTVEQRVANQYLLKVKKQEARETLGLVGAYEKLNRKRTEAQKRVADLLAIEEKDIKNKAKHNKALKNAQAEYAKLNKRVLAVDKATDNYTKNIGNYRSALGGLTNTVKSLISAFGVAGGIYTFVSVVKNGIGIVREFGATMANIAGIYRTSRKDLASLEEKIIAVAGASVNTATEVGQLAESLATLGKTQSEIETLLEPVNNLAIGLNASSDEAGEFLVQMLNTFGASTDEAGRYADVIATIRTSTSLDFEKMRDSFQYLAPISKALNKDISYTGALVGILADNGIKAERAGRLMGTAQQELASEGKTLNDALNELNKSKKNNVSELDLLAQASDLFGKQAAALGVVLANNTELIDVNANAIRNNSGALKDLVDEQLQSLDAHFKILASRWEEYILNADKSTGASNSLKKGLKFLSDNLTSLINGFIKVVTAIVTYKAVIVATSVVTRALTSASVALRIAKIALAGGIGKARKAMQLFNLTTKANPLGVVIAVLTTAIAMFYAFRDSVNATTKAQLELNKRIRDFNKELESREKKLNEEIDLKLKDLELSERQAKLGKSKAEQEKIAEEYRKKEAAFLREKLLLTGKDILESKDYLNIATKKYSELLQKKRDGISVDKEELLIQKNRVTEARNFVFQGIKLQERLKNRIKSIRIDAAEEQDRINNKANEDAKERDKKLAQNEHELAVQRLKIQSETQKEIFENEKNSYVERLTALSKHSDLERQIIEKNAKFEITQNKYVGDKKKAIEEKSKNDLEKLNKQANVDAGKLFVQKIKNVQKTEEDAQRQIEEKKAELREQFQNGRIKSEKDYQNQLSQATLKIQKEELNKKLDYLDEELDTHQFNAEQREIIEREISKVKKELKDLEFDEFVKSENEKQQRLQQIKNNFINATSTALAQAFGTNEATFANFFQSIIKGFDKSATKAERFAEIAKASINLIADLQNASYQRNIENIDAQIAKNDEEYSDAIEKATDKYDKEGNLLEKGERKRKILEDEKEKKRKALEKEKKKEQLKQAKFQRAMAALNIFVSTGQAVLGALAQVPKFDFGVSAGLLAASYATLGAVQLGAVLSAPLPKYKKGRKGGKAEFAIVGDGGVHEVREKKDGSAFLTPNTDTLAYLEEGEKVHSSLGAYFAEKQKENIDFKRAMFMANIQSQSANASEYERLKIINNTIDEAIILKAIEMNNNVIRHEIQRGFENVTIQNHMTIENEEYFERG